MPDSAQPTTSSFRLTAFLARSAPVAVVLRRGPTWWVQLIKWHTDTDTLEPGQWFNGRIYEAVCDLSPNEAYFLYSARKEKYPVQDADIGNCWGAISKPPYFTALAVWHSYGQYDGGGVFVSDTDIG